MSDPYEALGLQRGATEDEVKKTYRKLAREHHPDKGGDAEKFPVIVGLPENRAESEVQRGNDPKNREQEINHEPLRAAPGEFLFFEKIHAPCQVTGGLEGWEPRLA